MPSPYFEQYNSTVETSLLDDIYNEVIYLNGFSAYYIPIVNENKRDLIYGDDPLKAFDQAYKMDTYLINSTDYGDQQDFFSKFGLEVKNSVKVQIANREFLTCTPEEYVRPREGDLFYIPFLKNSGELFEIAFVNASKDLHALVRATPYSFELSLEPFKYNDESLNTGIPQIDIVEHLNSYLTTLTLQSGSGNYIVDEEVYQGANTNSYDAKATVSVWDSANSILTLISTKGEFTHINLPVVGALSQASYSLVKNENKIQNFSFDNPFINDEVDGLLDTSEDNPFGSLGR